MFHPLSGMPSSRGISFHPDDWSSGRKASTTATWVPFQRDAELIHVKGVVVSGRFQILFKISMLNIGMISPLDFHTEWQSSD